MSKVYLPSIHLATPSVTGTDAASKEDWIINAMRTHPDQKRAKITLHSLLMDAAEAKCVDMAKRGYTGHTTPEGVGANDWVRRFGYKLPDYYGKGRANSVESLAYGGTGAPEQIWDAWMNSPHHRTHILGTHEFFAKQICVGVGQYSLESAPSKHYWCILSAPPEA